MAFLSMYTLAQNMTKSLGTICKVSYIHHFLQYILYLTYNLMQRKDFKFQYIGAEMY